jgi:hypothetical protein
LETTLTGRPHLSAAREGKRAGWSEVGRLLGFGPLGKKRKKTRLGWAGKGWVRVGLFFFQFLFFYFLFKLLLKTFSKFLNKLLTTQ